MTWAGAWRTTRCRRCSGRANSDGALMSGDGRVGPVAATRAARASLFRTQTATGAP
jgi:hypothetical protein